jgi:DNA polymerase
VAQVFHSLAPFSFSGASPSGQPAPQSLAQLNQLILATPPFVPGAGRAVLGEGPLNAFIAFVGEQPGDAEDRAGRPFVGPAGKLLDRAMQESGIARGQTYLTNAVKHFKFEERGKRRIHSKPTAGEVKHYRWWLTLELQFVDPRLVVSLGATALLALAGKSLALSRYRGPQTFGDRRGFVTVHPSSLLRIPDAAEKRRAYHGFVNDLLEIKAISERLV